MSRFELEGMQLDHALDLTGDSVIFVEGKAAKMAEMAEMARMEKTDRTAEMERTDLMGLTVCQPMKSLLNMDFLELKLSGLHR